MNKRCKCSLGGILTANFLSKLSVNVWYLTRRNSIFCRYRCWFIYNEFVEYGWVGSRLRACCMYSDKYSWLKIVNCIPVQSSFPVKNDKSMSIFELALILIYRTSTWLPPSKVSSSKAQSFPPSKASSSKSCGFFLIRLLSIFELSRHISKYSRILGDFRATV